MSMPAPRTWVAQNQIPLVAELLDKLGFGTKAQRHNFQTSAKQWRRDYKCADGTPGKDLIQWGDSSTQGNLRRMTEDFLTRTNIAIKVWPKRTPGSPATALEWPTDERKIVMTLQQLFWQQNRNEARNAKNPARQHSVGDRSVSSDASPIVFTAPLIAKPSAKRTPYLSQRTRVMDSPPSSMETHKPDSRLISRSATSNEKPQKIRRPDIRSMEEIMAGTTDAEDESVPLNNHVNAADKRASNDVFDLPDSDEDVAREDIRIPSPKSLAPVANMVSPTAAPRDANFAFDAVPSNESKKTPKPQNKTRIPRTRKRARCLGSRVGSEEDDETYTPAKVKRKRNASRGSAASASPSKTQEKSNAVSNPARDKTPPTKDTPAGKVTLPRERQSPYESGNLMKRFKASNQSLKAPNNANSSRDSHASPSQTQRTIDVVQQYPEIAEHLRIWPAERQVALMSPTKVSTDRRSPTPPPAEQEPSWQPNSGEESREMQASLLKRYNEKDKNRNEARARTATYNELIPLTQSLMGSPGPTESSYQDMQTDDTTQTSSRINMAERPPIRFLPPPSSSGSLFIPTAGSTQSIYSQFSSSDRTPTEQHWPRTRNEPVVEREKNAMEPEPSEQMTHERDLTHIEESAQQTESKKEAHATKSLPTPSFEAPPMAHNQVTTPTPNTTTNRRILPPKPTLQVRYWIIESRLPECNRVKWLGGGLLHKSMSTLCTEIAGLIGRPVQRSIIVNLRTLSEGNSRSEIPCDKPEAFTELQDDFAREIKRQMKKGESLFEITLEPDPSGVGGMERGGVVEEEGDEDEEVEF